MSSSSAAAAAEEGQVIGCHTADEFDKQFQRGIDLEKLVVVDFTATWCPPCRFIAPVFAELAKKITHAIFLKVDVDELKTVSEKWGIEAMPTFLFFKGGKIVHKIVGADKEDLLRSSELHAAAPVATA